MESYNWSNSISKCHAWVVRRRDGRTFGFTDHDEAIEVDAIFCFASAGLSAGALESGTGLSVNNGDLLGALSHDVISADDIRNGLWDDAEVTVYRTDWKNRGISEVVFDGFIGEISIDDGSFSAELRSRTQRLNRVRGRVYEPRCDASLGDRRCGVFLDDRYSSIGLVEEVYDKSNVLITFDNDLTDGYFRHGELYVILGEKQTIVGAVKADTKAISGRILSLWEPMPKDLFSGQQVLAVAGCDKKIGTCAAKFSNAVNHRGFSTIPGEDWLMKHPSSR